MELSYASSSLLDKNGNILELSYIDNNLKRVTFGNANATKEQYEKWLAANKLNMSSDQYQKLSDELTQSENDWSKFSYGKEGATKKELESWLEANRERMSADEYARESAKLNKSINDWSVTSFINNNGSYTDRNGQIVAENEDIKTKKKQFAQQVKQGKLYKIEVDENGNEVVMEHDIGDTITKYDGREGEIEWSTVTSIKSLGEDLNRDISVKASEQKIKEGTINANISAIDNVLNQGKQQVEVEKNRPRYKAFEASDKARNITEQGGKK